MSSELICPECGSPVVTWDQAVEEFRCARCNTYFSNEDHIEQYFYKLDLVDWQLNTIPGWVFPRWYLKKIDLSSEPNDSFHAPFCNRINEIPPEIRYLVNLEELDLAHNNIEAVPPEIGNLKKLKKLYLSKNKLKSLPEETGFLSNLECLELEDNKLVSLPETIVNLKNLKELTLSGNTGLISPPYHIAIRGIQSIREWFNER